MIFDVNPSDGIFVSGDNAVFISTLDFIFAYSRFSFDLVHDIFGWVIDVGDNVM